MGERKGGGLVYNFDSLLLCCSQMMIVATRVKRSGKPTGGRDGD